jgi:hypothetical protein
MKKILGTLSLAALLTTTSMAGGSAMVCEDTGVTVETCCCVETDAGLVCTLTGETVSSCCCTPAE